MLSIATPCKYFVRQENRTSVNLLMFFRLIDKLCALQVSIYFTLNKLRTTLHLA